MPDDLYREQIIAYAQHPQYRGELATPPTHAAAEQNLSCGDDLAVDLQVNDAGVITAVAWRGQGCIISQAAASVVTENLIGQPLATAQQWGLPQIEEWLGAPLSPARQKCALLVIRCLRRVARHA
jgi:nitrogen fixation protein NifU and related proteins